MKILSLLLLTILLTAAFYQPVEDAHMAAAPTLASRSTQFRTSVIDMPVGKVTITIDKSDYELHVYDNLGWYATYPVVFGGDPMKDKRVEGDRLTPEGSFKIVNKRVHPKWNRFLLLDYPNAETLRKFNERKRRGELPANASPGGGVGIHGTWDREEYAIDRFANWTLGCISLKNADVQEIYSYVPNGTVVTIKR